MEIINIKDFKEFENIIKVGEYIHSLSWKIEYWNENKDDVDTKSYAKLKQYARDYSNIMDELFVIGSFFGNEHKVVRIKDEELWETIKLYLLNM